MTSKYIRCAGPAFLILALAVFAPSTTVRAQAAHGRGNARIMSLSLQFDPDSNKVACLGTPDTLKVGRNEFLVLHAVGTFVNDVRWADEQQLQGMGKVNPGKANLAKDGATHSGSFGRGAAYTFQINPAIPRGTAYTLQVECGNTDDGPPVIIVDP